MSKINTNKEQPDLLGDLFKRIPEEELPASFRSNVMRQIMLESAKAKKRDERFSLLAAIVASLIMISLAIVSFVYMEIPKIAVPTISTSALAFYLYIGAITLILLLADYIFVIGIDTERCGVRCISQERISTKRAPSVYEESMDKEPFSRSAIKRQIESPKPAPGL